MEDVGARGARLQGPEKSQNRSWDADERG